MSTLSPPGTPRSANRFPLWNPMTTMDGFSPGGRVVCGAEGVRVWDEAGHVCLDGFSGLWNVSFGYSNRHIIAAIKAQLDVLPYSTLFGGRTNRPAIELARRLAEVCPIEDGRVFFTTSGGAGIDTALKLARRAQRLMGHPERDTVVALRGSYHGTSYGSMMVTGEDLDQDEYGPAAGWVRHVAHDNPADLLGLARDLGGRLAAIVVEPVLGTGALVLGQEMVGTLHATCAATGAFLIVDEVTTGFGRTGTLFACEQTGLRPDLLVLSKAITGGYLPLAATVCRGDICDAFDSARARFSHGETQSGNPIACAAALAVLDVVTAPGFLESVAGLSARLTAGLDQLCGHPLVEGHRGLGLMRSIQLVDSDGDRFSDELVAAALEAIRQEGALVYASPGGLAVLPPLVMSGADLDELLACIARGLDRVPA
jgi:adenosylmethionine-8-amino-7-oxononanoate aminotransferase